MSFLKKTINGLSKTRRTLRGVFSGFVGKSILEESDLEEIEQTLISSDIGWELTDQIVNKLSEPHFKEISIEDRFQLCVEEYLKDVKPKSDLLNVILLIGDGNGLSQISSSTLANGGELTLTQLKNIGFIKTSSADDFTTDSAAAGTAIAIGKKTYNRAIGVDHLGAESINICEVLQEKNFNTAVITTDEITGATPAAFYAHQKDRGMTQQIAADLYKSDLTLFAGGGAKYFKKQLPFNLVNTPEAIANAKAARIGYFMADGGVPSTLNGRGEELPKVVAHSLEFLKQKETPFFAMIEAAQIDSYGHFNDVAGIVSEGIDFDKAITEAVKFADENPGTLVIVTADHETSGFSIPQGNLEHHTIEGDFTTHDHTATMVPVFAYGPQAQGFTGVYENNEIYHKILALLR